MKSYLVFISIMGFLTVNSNLLYAQDIAYIDNNLNLHIKNENIQNIKYNTRNKSILFIDNSNIEQLGKLNAFEIKASKKPYWFIGLTATALGVAGLILNKSAKSNYKLYMNETDDENLRDTYYEKSNSQKKNAEILMGFSAVCFSLNIIIVISN